MTEVIESKSVGLQAPETIQFLSQELTLPFQSEGESAKGEPLKVWQYLPANADPKRWHLKVDVKLHQDPSVTVEDVVREKVQLINARRANGDSVAGYQTYTRGDGEAVIVDMLASAQLGDQLILEHSIVRIAKPGDHVVGRYMARRHYVEEGDEDRRRPPARVVHCETPVRLAGRTQGVLKEYPLYLTTTKNKVA